MGLFNMFKKKLEHKGFNSGLIVNSLDITNPDRLSRKTSIESNNGWVYGVTNLVANNIAFQKLKLYVKTNKNQAGVKNFETKVLNILEKKSLNLISDATVEQIIDYPAQTLIRNCNNYTDGFNLIYMTQLWMDLVGDAYWYIVKDTNNTPIEIHLLNALNMLVVPNSSSSSIQGYLFQGKNGNIAFSTDEIVKFSNSGITSKWYGTSPLMAQSGIVGGLKIAEGLEYSLLKNSGIPPLILKYKGNLTKPEIRTLELEWKRATTGNKNGNIKVMDSNFETENIAQELDKLLLKEYKIMNLKSICLAYGVPYSLIDTADQKKAGLDQILEMLSLNCVIPRLTRIEQVLNQQYLPMFDTTGDLRFHYDDPSPYSQKQEADILTSYVSGGILSVDEARGILGL